MLHLFSPAVPSRSFFYRRPIFATLLAVSVGAAAVSPAVYAQSEQPQQAPATVPSAAPPAQVTPDPSPTDAPDAVLSNTTGKKGKSRKGEERVVKSKDTVKDQREQKRRLKDNPLANVNSSQPDKQLYDKAQVALKKGHFDVARLELQTLLATYPDSEYQMRAKLSFADSWYREGGTAALTQAETEYHDFIVFFPNVPEAAEAQFRIGEIYYKQMDKPDRDYAKALHAQEEYRTLLSQYPDSALVPQAKQRLREVQEAMATRETGIGTFYLGRENWAAAIARLQTVVDTYPLYSHIDDALIGLGDAYSAEVRFIRKTNLPEDAKGRLLKIYNDQAAAAYGRVVTQYSASPRVEDARDRLEAIGAPVPTPTPEQVAASQALENSRKSYTLANRAKGLIIRGPDVVQAATLGEPAQADPKPTVAPQIARRAQDDFNAALHPGAAAPAATTDGAAAGTETTAPPADATPAPAAATAPPTLQDIPSAGATSAGSNAGTFATPAARPASGGGNTVGVEILSTGGGSTPNGTVATPTANGLSAVGPNNTALPAAEKPDAAPDAVNDVAGVKTPQGQAPVLDKNGKPKKVKPEFDKGDESSSTHKKKKGLKKLNPL